LQTTSSIEFRQFNGVKVDKSGFEVSVDAGEGFVFELGVEVKFIND
jgi:hypothetical protein